MPLQPKRADRGSALICFWEGYLGVAPTILNAAHALTAEGYTVEILCLEQGSDFAAEPQPPPGVSIRRLPALGRRRFWNAWPRLLRAPARALATLLDYARAEGAARRISRRHQPRLIFGVDPYGLSIAAAAQQACTGAVLAYWSLELVEASRLTNPVDRWMKSREAGLADRAAALIVQDPSRDRVLRAGLSPEPPPTLLVPNTPLGAAPPADRGFLHRRLGLAQHEKIVLSAGVINDEVLSRDIAASAREWPENWRLVLHERERRDPSEPYLQEVMRLGGGRPRLSLQPVTLDRVDDVFASARVGLVTYSPDLGPNYSEIAFASGKLGYFLRNGVPILVNDIPSLRALVEEAGCGLVVDAVENLPDALEAIEANYAAFSQAALDFYQRRLEFGAHFAAALARLTSASPTRRRSHSGGMRSGK